MSELSRLMQRLQYTFSDPALLPEALSHRSSGRRNYERLEFLGDSLLNFVVAEALYQRHPELDEGALSRLRASLVRGTTLAELARELDLGEFLILGSGELKSGGFDRDSILADVVESLLGAVYLDAGFDTSKALVLRLFAERLDSLPPAGELKDAKTRLQELLQGQGIERPQYELLETSGKAHELRFRVRCAVPSCSLEVEATHSSRRKAEQAAAALMIEALQASTT